MLSKALLNEISSELNFHTSAYDEAWEDIRETTWTQSWEGLVELSEDYEDSEKTGAEFECVQGAELMDHGTARPAEGKEETQHRKWIVKHVHLDKEGFINITDWSVNSAIDYTCSAGQLTEGWM